MKAYKLVINNREDPTEVAFTKIYPTLEEAVKVLIHFKRANITGTIVDCMTFKEVTNLTGVTKND
tara:strand:- start:2279 stop:2473 length:195 start_codon:yes stop_codon:yes gene_type:complete